MSKRRATKPYQPKFREYKPSPHPRQADFESLPRPVTMPGVGNGKERQHGFGRG